MPDYLLIDYLPFRRAPWAVLEGYYGEGAPNVDRGTVFSANYHSALAYAKTYGIAKNIPVHYSLDAVEKRYVADGKN